MTYRITYTTDTVPENVPGDATIEKISTFPLEFGKDFRLDESVLEDDVAYFDCPGMHLTREQTVQVRDALNELLGESVPEWDGYSEPPADVIQTRDKDGDYWFRIKPDTWATNKDSECGDPWSWPARYAPHTIVRRGGVVRDD